MDKKRIDVISLGCSKNLVDSERLLKQLELSGFQAFHNSDNVDGDIVIINTCGFIGDAKEESINTILTYAEAKNEGRIKELYVMGCLSERYRDDLLAEIPEIDRIYGKFDWVNIVSDIIKRNPATMPYDRVITTPSHYTYPSAPHARPLCLYQNCRGLQSFLCILCNSTDYWQIQVASY